MHLYFIFKDAITVFAFLFAYFFLISYYLEYLGDLENNILGNLLVTLLAINLLFLFIYFLFILYNNNNILTYINQKTNNLEFIKNELKLNLQFKLDLNFNKDDFRKIMNGLFQAKGNINCELHLLEKTLFNISLNISLTLNSSLEIISLFKHLNYIFDNKLNYNFIINSQNIEIQMYCCNREIIINKLILFFNNVFGDKKRNFMYIIKIYYLYDICNNISNLYKISINNILSHNNNLLSQSELLKLYDTLHIIKYISYSSKIIYLICSIINNNQKLIIYSEYINKYIFNRLYNLDNIINKIKNKKYYSLNYYENYNNKLLQNKFNKYFKINSLFIMGYFIGEGYLDISIEYNLLNKKIKLLIYNINLYINQKNTYDNKLLFEIIQEFLKINYDIKTNIYLKSKDKEENYYIIIKISSNKDYLKISKYIKNYTQYFYSKKLEFNLLIGLSSINNISKYWRILALIKLNLIKEYNIIKMNKFEYLSIKEIYNKYLFFLKEESKLDINLLKNILLTKNIHNELKYLFLINISHNTLLLIFTNFFINLINLYFNKYEAKNIKFGLFIYFNKLKDQYYVKLLFKTILKRKYYSSHTNNILKNAIEYRNTQFIIWLNKSNFNKYYYLLEKYYNIKNK